MYLESVRKHGLLSEYPKSVRKARVLPRQNKCLWYGVFAD